MVRFKIIMDKITAKELTILSTISEEVKKQFRLDVSSIHGMSHWDRVREIGIYLAITTGADLQVIGLFSALHDSQRENDGSDPEHGLRAGEYIKMLFAKGLLPLNKEQLEQLTYACVHHNNCNAQSDDVTIQTCWDADRLDLYRVGEIPNPKLLYTNIAKERKTIDFAFQLLKSWLISRP